MNHVIIIGKNLNIFEDLSNFFENRNISIIKPNENNDLPNLSGVALSGLNIETIICSTEYEKHLGGQEKLLAFARENKIKKIIIISEDKNIEDYTILNELGGALKRLTFNDIYNKITKEIIFHCCVTDNSYSAGDEKTFELLSLSRRVALTDVTVFINGPTGSGKEVLANYLHEYSNRKEEPFVAVNCAAIPENMLEAILFGHEKGAFTGASNANKGIFRAADKGTLLLDEISEMPLSLQAKLLRVLQEKSVTPIGSQKEVPVNVRVIATTNRNMANEIKDGNFREDLYYRLNVFPLATSNLAARNDDIIPLTTALLYRHCDELKHLPWLDETAVGTLLSHDWPGNVRELENIVQRALVLCSEQQILSTDIIIDNNPLNSPSFNQLEPNIQQRNLVSGV